MAAAKQVSRTVRTAGPKEQTFEVQYVDRAKKNLTTSVQARSLADARVKAKQKAQSQGGTVVKVKKQSAMKKGGKITSKDITLFTRQLATMMKSGVPLLTAFDIVAKGNANPAVARLLTDVKNDVGTGSSLSQAFKKYPLYFDDLFCNLVEAGEAAGILDTVLDRLATYKEKILAIKGKIKSALAYPVAIIVVAFVITAVIMIFVVPSFKELFDSFGANLPTPTLVVMQISDIFVTYWYFIFGGIFGTIYGITQALRRSPALRHAIERLSLKMPVFGPLLVKSSIARWTRTLATMFSAGVPLVDALESVAGAAGNVVYYDATMKIQAEVKTGTNLTAAMMGANLFPNMVLQMVQIGEESGNLDGMLSKVADFYEAEVDDAVAGLSSLMEPMIMVVLGVLIGGLVVAMYLPIFKMGEVV